MNELIESSTEAVYVCSGHSAAEYLRHVTMVPPCRWSVKILKLWRTNYHCKSSIPQSESRVIKWQAHQFVRGTMQRRGDQLQEDLRTRRGRISRRSAPRSTPRTATTTSTMLNWKTRPQACLQRSENVSSLTWFVRMFVSIWPK